jgi:hypothetical protein
MSGEVLFRFGLAGHHQMGFDHFGVIENNHHIFRGILPKYFKSLVFVVLVNPDLITVLKPFFKGASKHGFHFRLSCVAIVNAVKKSAVKFFSTGSATDNCQARHQEPKRHKKFHVHQHLRLGNQIKVAGPLAALKIHLAIEKNSQTIQGISPADVKILSWLKIKKNALSEYPVAEYF